MPYIYDARLVWPENVSAIYSHNKVKNIFIMGALYGVKQHTHFDEGFYSRISVKGNNVNFISWIVVVVFSTNTMLLNRQ